MKWNGLDCRNMKMPSESVSLGMIFFTVFPFLSQMPLADGLGLDLQL